MQSRIEDIHAAGAEVLAICVDPVAENAKVARKLKLGFPVLSDPGLETITAYGVRHQGGSIEGGDIARPAVFYVDGDGVVRWRQLTDNWRVRVRPEQVLEALGTIP